VKEFADPDPSDYDSDSAGDLFPNSPKEADYQRLNAEIVATLKYALTIRITVSRTGGDPPSGPITILLHPSFGESVPRFAPAGDKETRTIYSAGTFTVVAILDESKTMIGYPLTELAAARGWLLIDRARRSAVRRG
jgi:hypothetical protein